MKLPRSTLGMPYNPHRYMSKCHFSPRLQDYLKAAAAYTKAIRLDRENAVLYSNRSAAMLKLYKVSKALEDAIECVRLNPVWDKGYFRKAAIQEVQGDYSAAHDSYRQALEFNPDNKDIARKVALMAKKSGKPPKPSPPAPSPAPASATASSTSSSNSTWEDMGSPETVTFVESWIANMVTEVREDGKESLEPMLHFQIGLEAPTSDQEKLSHVRAVQAFITPETTLGFIEYLRTTAEDLQATAVLAIVPKSKVGFPQVWKRDGWNRDQVDENTDGVIVQLESNGGGKKVRRVWFFPFPKKGSTTDDGRSLENPVGMDPEKFSLLPTLLKL